MQYPRQSFPKWKQKTKNNWSKLKVFVIFPSQYCFQVVVWFCFWYRWKFGQDRSSDIVNLQSTSSFWSQPCYFLVYAYADYIPIPNDCIGNIRYHGKIIALLFATEDGNVTLWNVLCEGTNRIISTRGTMTAAYRFPFTTRSILHWSNFKAYSLILPLIKCPDFALCFFPLMFHFSSDTALHLLNGKAKRTGFLQTGY